jgi:hypothetical protein
MARCFFASEAAAMTVTQEKKRKARKRGPWIEAEAQPRGHASIRPQRRAAAAPEADKAGNVRRYPPDLSIPEFLRREASRAIGALSSFEMRVNLVA